MSEVEVCPPPLQARGRHLSSLLLPASGGSGRPCVTDGVTPVCPSSQAALACASVSSRPSYCPLGLGPASLSYVCKDPVYQ